MKTPNHILVIRLSAMGDVGMTVPVLRVLAQTYPALSITILSTPHFKPLFDGIPNLNFLAADVYGSHKGFGIFKLANEAKALGIDAVADLHNVIRSKAIANYLGFKGVQKATLDKGRAQKKALIQAKGKPIFPLKSMHQRYADVFEQLGLPIDLSKHVFPKRKQLSPRHTELIGDQPKKLIGIAPFAAHTGKMYPLELMKEVIVQLNATGNYKLFLFGGGSEEIKSLKLLAKEFESVTNIAGTLMFEEELALLANMDLMISMDSGNGHLAALYNVPVITLWGVTHPYTGFTPFGQPNAHQIVSNRELYPLIPTSIYGNKVPKGYEKVMESIPVSLVVEKVLSML